jgi:glycyl-tRNA synthetase alpha chain
MARRLTMSAASPLLPGADPPTLHSFWAEQGLRHPAALRHGGRRRHLPPGDDARALGPKPWKAAYVQPSRRPKDGRYGENPNRLQHYYQYQVILKPSPSNLQELYLEARSRRSASIQPARHPLRRGRLGEPDARRLGPRLGMLVRRHGSQPVHLFPAGLPASNARPLPGELTYGLERLAMYVQGVENVYDLNFNGREGERSITYGDVFLQAEQEYLAAQFRARRYRAMLFRHFSDAEAECQALLAAGEAGADSQRPDATSWPCRPMTSASRRAMSSTCSMRAA